MHDDPLDLEELSKTGQRPHHHTRRFRIRVDLETYVVDKPVLTGREILTIAGKTPAERFLLRERFRHHHKPRDIGLDDHVDLTEACVERFTTLPRDQTDGETAAAVRRRQFPLSEEDAAALDELGLEWETLKDPTGLWVLQHDCPVPEGFKERSVSIAVRVETGYPRTPLDMAYMDPPLHLVSGRDIPATQATQMIDGRSWQRWSRHYTPANPWRVGEHSIATHLVLAHHWIERELSR